MDLTLRQRQQLGARPSKKEPYSRMVEQREEIKTNTNRVNCFVDDNQPEFINTMSRTMDAFNVQMSTFGGTQAKDKHKKVDKFMQEKGGYINMQTKLANSDTKAFQRGNGPALQSNFTNKYKEQSSFATNRFKEPLNINKVTTDLLETAEKIESLDELKESSIRFLHPDNTNNSRFKCITNMADHQSGQKI